MTKLEEARSAIQGLKYSVVLEALAEPLSTEAGILGTQFDTSPLLPRFLEDSASLLRTLSRKLEDYGL